MQGALADDWDAVLRQMADADLLRMHVLSTDYAGMPYDRLPREVLDELQALVLKTVRTATVPR